MNKRHAFDRRCEDGKPRAQGPSRSAGARRSTAAGRGAERGIHSARSSSIWRISAIKPPEVEIHGNTWNDPKPYVELSGNRWNEIPANSACFHIFSPISTLLRIKTFFV